MSKQVRTYNNGDRYEGELKGEIRNGKGVYTFAASGNRYDGNWKNDTFDGQGVFYWKDGSKYDGQWKNGKKKEKEHIL